MAELMVRIMYLIWRANNMFGRCAGKLKRLDGVWWWCPFFFSLSLSLSLSLFVPTYRYYCSGNLNAWTIIERYKQ